MSCEKDLRVITEKDNPSVVYKVPNYCITDPVIERDYQSIKEKCEGVESEPLTVTCFCFTNLKEIAMEVTNRTTGKEIKDEHLLCYHNVVNGGKILISCVSL